MMTWARFLHISQNYFENFMVLWDRGLKIIKCSLIEIIINCFIKEVTTKINSRQRQKIFFEIKQFKNSMSTPRCCTRYRWNQSTLAKQHSYKYACWGKRKKNVILKIYIFYNIYYVLLTCRTENILFPKKRKIIFEVLIKIKWYFCACINAMCNI